MRFILAILLLVECAVAQGVLTRPFITREFIACGDSITARVYEQSNYLDHLVQELIPRPGAGSVHEFRSMGLSGTGFIYNYTNAASVVYTNMTADLTNRVLPLLSSLSPATRKDVIVFGGTNDKFLGTATTNQIYTAFTNYLWVLLTNGVPTNRIWVITMLPRQSYSEADRTNINFDFMRGCSNYAVNCIAVHTNALVGIAGQQSNATYFLDLIHPTATGHRVIASNIFLSLQ